MGLPQPEASRRAGILNDRVSKVLEFIFGEAEDDAVGRRGVECENERDTNPESNLFPTVRQSSSLHNSNIALMECEIKAPKG
jgi:hypothetical protein